MTPTTRSNITIQTATVSDLNYIVDLQRRHSNALGFLPRMALAEYVTRRQVMISFENDAPAGYVLYRPTTRHDSTAVNIIQTAVQMDAQRRHIGLALLHRLNRHATNARKRSLQCKCATDLESNSFWLAAGFEPVVSVATCCARGRTITFYKKPISR